MARKMLVDALHPGETRVVITDRSLVEEFDFITAAKSQLKGNIYLAKVTRVEPSLQAAFVEYGGDKQGFLPFSEIHPDYYQIPIADRKRIMEEEEKRLEQEARQREERRIREEAEEAARMEAGGEAQQERGDDDEEEEDGEDGTPGNRNRSRRRGRRRTMNPREREERAASESVTGEISGESGGEAEMGEQPEALDTASEDDELEQARRTAHLAFSRRYKIQEVIKRNQILLVQVIKDERGTKGASLTTYISLAGRYCVLMPNASKEGGISRKIARFDDRKRLRKIAAELKEARGMSAIIRTAGIDRTKTEIKRDYEYLIKLWNSIRELALESTAPALIYEENNILKRAIRDYYQADIESVVVQGDDAYRSIKEMMKMAMPSHAARVKQYKGDAPIFGEFGVESQLQAMYKPTVRLKSGGYLVINPTEALISIDVNSGRSTTERNVEETALKTNLEAAAEVARQLRLRDLGGLIVIDFIDMYYGKNRRNVERAFKEALRSDRAKIQVGHISPFGLLELSRQRMRPSIGESSTVSCPHCHGSGSIRSLDSLSIEIVRLLEQDASAGNLRELRVKMNPDLAVFMLNSARSYLNGIEARFGVKIVILVDNTLVTSSYAIEKIRGGKDQPQGQKERREPDEVKQAKPAPSVDDEDVDTDEDADTNADEEASSGERPDSARRRNRSRRRRGGRRDDRPYEARDRQNAGDAMDEEDTPEERPSGRAAKPADATSDDGEAEAKAPAKPRGRPRRSNTESAVKKDANDAKADKPVKATPSGEKADRPLRPAQKAIAGPAKEESVEAKAPVRRRPPRNPAASEKPVVVVHTEPEASDGQPRKGWWNRATS